MIDSINRLQQVYDSLLSFLQTKNITPGQPKAHGLQSHFRLLKVQNLKELRVACIMDEFTCLCFDPECKLIELSPNNWQTEIDELDPDILFIESAWQGKDGLWYRKVANGSAELYALADYCKRKYIPIIFWDKESPTYTHEFMPAAAIADFIFTTDFDAIAKFKAGTGNDKVYHLHFAAQPKLHNPIEKYPRTDKFCFAGAYYHRYKQRCKVFDEFSDYFVKSRGFDIYDRNYGNARPEHAFPEYYRPHILGNLPPDKIDKAYKGYYFGVNMNSATQSQTMFARRLFELMASNTIVVGNYSRGVKNYFGDLTICTDSVDTLQKTLSKYCGDDLTLRKYRLKALRAVLMDNLYEDRLSYIVEKVFGKTLKPMLPRIAVVVCAKSAEKAGLIVEAFDRQVYNNKVLYYVSDDSFEIENAQPILSEARLSSLSADYVAFFSSNDFYGENYLTDLALATRYLDEGITGIGKAAYYKDDNFIGLNCAYNYVADLAPRRAMIKINAFIDKTVSDLTDNNMFDGKFFSVDEFNYCFEYGGNDCKSVCDLPIMDEGIRVGEVQCYAENVPMPHISDAMLSIAAFDVALLFNKSTEKRGLTASLQDGKLIIDCRASNDAAEYIYIGDYYTITEMLVSDTLEIKFNAEDSNVMGLVVIFYDINKVKIDSKFLNPGRILSLKKSSESLAKTEYFRIALRFKGQGQCVFKSITNTGRIFLSDGDKYLLRSDTLILSNIYPSYENLYRNMFVHARVKAYQRLGRFYDVMCMNIYAKDGYREFDGINVIEGHAQTLNDMLNSGMLKTVCVHFLDEHMFAILKEYLDRIRIVVWIHGSDIQPWWRREYNHIDDAERESAKVDSAKRMAFWNEVFAKAQTANIYFVFVSQYFADEVMEDYKLTLPKDKYSIIHNIIDTEKFDYEEKGVEQRKMIFSCCPWSTRKYANDLCVNTIIALSKTKEFSDMRFHIAGMGELFKGLSKPLRKFKNVVLEERYYTHDEIAALHKEHGVCLVPTRWDSHGVSRDEAMSSGLVPVTNSVAAIPEFVDDDCGILVPGEDFMGLANGILKLYHSPEMFSRMSHNAAMRVRKQSSEKLIADMEISLIEGKERNRHFGRDFDVCQNNWQLKETDTDEAHKYPPPPAYIHTLKIR